MFFYRREENLIAEGHRDSIRDVFLLGGLSGACVAAHYVFAVIHEYDYLKIIEWMVSTGWYGGVLSIGFFRSFQYCAKQGKQPPKSGAKTLSILLGTVVMTGGASFSALIGAVPLAFIDFVGGGLIGRHGSLSDFFLTLRNGLLVGGVFGFCISSFLHLGITLRVIAKKWFLLLAPLCGSIISGLLIWLWAKNYNFYIIWYSTFYGILLGVTFVIHDVRNKRT